MMETPSKSTYRKFHMSKNILYHDIPISVTPSAKYLGVILDSKLTWKEQYRNISKKCNNTLAFLRRNLPPNCPRQVREKSFNTLVRPFAEYGCQVWDPHYQTDIQYLEKIQKRGARFATNNFCMEHGNSEKNLKNLGWNTLEERRLQLKLSTFKKAHLNLLELPLDKLQPKTRLTRQGGDGLSYKRPFSPVNSYMNSFFPTVTQIWNLLPAETRQCSDINAFNDAIKKTNLTQIKYGLLSGNNNRSNMYHYFM